MCASWTTPPLGTPPACSLKLNSPGISTINRCSTLLQIGLPITRSAGLGARIPAFPARLQPRERAHRHPDEAIRDTKVRRVLASPAIYGEQDSTYKESADVHPGRLRGSSGGGVAMRTTGAQRVWRRFAARFQRLRPRKISVSPAGGSQFLKTPDQRLHRLARDGQPDPRLCLWMMLSTRW